MQIIHVIDDFLFELFPEAKDARSNADILIAKLQEYYAVPGLKPKVTIEGNLAIVDIEQTSTKENSDAFQQAISCCNKGDFVNAKRLLSDFLVKNPAHSEANRVLGQILSEEGDQEKAQDYLIEALRWNPKNASALIMLGNIFSNYKKDVKTSQKYFDQAIKVNPNDYIILNNVGGNLLKMHEYAEAKGYFVEALKIKDNYPNTHFGLALIAEAEKDLASCFCSSTKTLKLSRKGEALYEQATKLTFQIAERIIQDSDAAHGAVEKYLATLQNGNGVEIRLEADRKIALPAYLELAEKYKRKEHIVRFNPDHSTRDYWVMHALVMLGYVLEARAENTNKLFYTDNVTRNHFARSIAENLQTLRDRGIPEAALKKLADDLYVGLNQQIHNTPVGLFVEEYIYHEFAELRPHQFISLHGDLQTGIKGATNQQIREMSPENVFSVSKIYNLLKAHHFRDLFGLDLIGDFEADANEERQAISMFHEFSEYRHDKNPSDEYKLLQSWANVLNVDSYFELIPENGSAAKKTETDAHADAEMEKFQKKAAAQGLNMAVVMYMQDALEFFAQKDNATIKKAAMEIAMLGMNGIKPEQQGYKLTNVPEKVFSGYHLLAYYYVSFALVLPEMLKELKIPYDQEYDLAMQMRAK